MLDPNEANRMRRLAVASLPLLAALAVSFLAALMYYGP